jgi:hypothetical protein
MVEVFQPLPLYNYNAIVYFFLPKEEKIYRFKKGMPPLEASLYYLI